MGEIFSTYSLTTLLLLPLSVVYWLLYKTHKLLYSLSVLKTHRLPVPVIVVGNLTVGGTGKTPLVIWLAQYLKAAGFDPGIVSRGYRGEKTANPVQVHVDSAPQQTGDEPLLIARHTGLPVYVHRDRVKAANALLAEHHCNVILSDDGLQHYRLERDIEIVVIDGQRRFGNGLLFPAGPLRESRKRLADVDFILCRGGHPRNNEVPFATVPAGFHNLVSAETLRPGAFAGRKVHAVAGIGNPLQFFRLLEKLDIEVIPHAYPDHYSFSANDLEFDDDLPVIMTEKDAVKCQHFARPRHWYMAIESLLPDDFGSRVVALLNKEPNDG